VIAFERLVNIQHLYY